MRAYPSVRGFVMQLYLLQSRNRLKRKTARPEKFKMLKELLT